MKKGRKGGGKSEGVKEREFRVRERGNKGLWSLTDGYEKNGGEGQGSASKKGKE